MNVSEGLPHQERIAQAMVEGRLGKLILANTDVTDLPGPWPLERPEPDLSDLDVDVAVEHINGQSRRQNAASHETPLSPARVDEILANTHSRLRTADMAHMARYLFCLGYALPDEELPDVTFELSPTGVILFGLRTHGLSRQQVKRATDPWGATGVVRIIRETARGLLEPPGLDSLRQSPHVDGYAARVAFEFGVFSSAPDLLMPPPLFGAWHAAAASSRRPTSYPRS